MDPPTTHRIGQTWRSSKPFIVSCVTIAIFSENFLYSFIVPILPTMLEGRLHQPPSQTQRLTYQLLSVHAVTSVISGPVVGHVADKVASRKVSLMASLGAEVVGTGIVAGCFSLPLLFLGRIIQAIGGIAVWIVGSATIADTVGKGSLATTLSMISVFFAAGVILGPMVAGALMHWFGYWVTWAVVLVVLGVDIFMRLVMIEDRDEGKKESVSNGRGEVGERGDEDAAVSIPVEEDETTSLLDDQRAGSGKNRQVATDTDTGGKEGRPAGNFYAIMLRRSRVLTALMAHLTNSIVLAGFDTTLPLHVKRVFGWNTLDAGLMFGLLQLPVMVLSPVTGRLKDKIGMCYPAAIGYLMMAPLLWLLGSPGDEGTAWLGSDQKGRTVYMVTIVCIGLGRSFTVGTASIELTHVAKEVQEDQPGIFGPNGGLSRVYSLTNTAWNIGMLVGPPVTGSLAEHVGYYYMNLGLAMMCVVTGTLALIYLQRK